MENMIIHTHTHKIITRETKTFIITELQQKLGTLRKTKTII